MTNRHAVLWIIRLILFFRLGLFGLGGAVEIVGRLLAAAETEDVACGSFGLMEDHPVSFQGDVIDAEENDGLAVVALVEALLEFDSLGRIVVGETLRIRPFKVEPKSRDVGGVKVQTAVFGGEIRRVRGFCGGSEDGQRSLDFKFVDYPETIRCAAEILVRVEGFTGTECKGGKDDSHACQKDSFCHNKLFYGRYTFILQKRSQSAQMSISCQCGWNLTELCYI